MLVHKVHECRFVKKWEHAIEVLEEIFEQRQGFMLRWHRLVDLSMEDVPKDIWLPVYPFVVVDGRI